MTDTSPERVVDDLRLYLPQLARTIADHQEYERQIAHGLPPDSGLILRFDIGDYVADVCDFFARKGITPTDDDLLFRGMVELLVPPESARDTVSPHIWRQLFAGTLATLAERFDRPLPQLTKYFYHRISQAGSLNGVPSTQVLQYFQEALDLVPSRSAPAGDRGTASVDFDRAADLTRRAFAACGAGTYRALRVLVMRRHGLELVSSLLVMTSAAVAIVAVAPALSIRGAVLEAPFSPATVIQAAVILVYAVGLSVRIQRYRLRSSRRRILVRMFSSIVETFDLSYQDTDRILRDMFGTGLAELRRAFLPRRR